LETAESLMAASAATAMLASQWATLVTEWVLEWVLLLVDAETETDVSSTVAFDLAYVAWFLVSAACSLDADAKLLLLLADAKHLLLIVAVAATK
jgi:hypothetical protein